jgi:hypothetical protein
MAIGEALIAEKLDPLNPMIGSLVAEQDYLAHDYEKAIAQYKKSIGTFPKLPICLGRSGECTVLFEPKSVCFKFMEAVAGNYGQ